MEQPKIQPPQEARLHFLDYWRIIRIRKAIIITVFLITALIATAVTFMLPEYYSSSAQVEIEPENVSDINTPSGSTPYGGYDAYFIQTEFEIIQGPLVLGKVVDMLNLNVQWASKYGVQTLKTSETIGYLKNYVSLSPVRNTKLIEISVFDADKVEAATLANTIAKAYHDYRLERFQQQEARGIGVLETNYLVEEDQIKMIQTNVDTLRRELNIVDSDPNSFVPTATVTQDQLQQYHNLMFEGQTRYMRLKEQLDQLKALGTNELRDVLPAISQGSALPALLDNLRTQKQRYVGLTNDITSENLEMKRLLSLINELNQQIDACVTGIMIGLDHNLNTERVALNTLSNEVETATLKDREEAVRGQPYWQKKRELANKLELHKLLQMRIESEKINMAIPKTYAALVTRPAEVGKSPVRPNKPLNIGLGLFFGLMIGIGLAFFIEYLDTSVKTIDDVERAFQAPVLGVIPQNVGYLVDEGPESRYAEAYRVLRTNLLFSRKDDKFRTVVIVSAGAGEGKSTTALNLATVFAQAGQRVLIVDSDLRRPTLHKLLRVSNDIGLTNYLLKQNPLEEVIQTTGVPMLNFMASGKLPSSSMSILNSAHMKDMIAELKQRYDLVFFDSPPILGVSDASVLASEVDMVLQVIQYRRYPQPMNLRAKQVIEKVGGNFLGIVLNNINMSQDESYYYYSGYYHDYYSSGGEKEQEAAAAKDSEDADRGGIKQKY
jgi:capsular exopolysaccharide synthesis family protein